MSCVYGSLESLSKYLIGLSRIAVSTWVLTSTHYIKIEMVLDVNDVIDMNQKAEETMINIL